MFLAPTPTAPRQRQQQQQSQQVRVLQDLPSAVAKKGSPRTTLTISQPHTPLPPQVASVSTLSAKAVTPGTPGRKVADVSSSSIIGAGYHQTQQILLKNDTQFVYLVSPLPPDLAFYLRQRDFDLEDVVAVLDQRSGFSVVVGQESCLVWQYQRVNQAAASTIPVREFPLPPSMGDNDRQSLQHAIVCLIPPPIDDPRESGLLACTNEGSFRYWQSLGYEVDNAKEAQVFLPAGDYAKHLINCEPAGFIMGTSSGNLFQVSLSNASGQPSLSYCQLARPATIFARVSSILGYGGDGSSAPQAAVDPSRELVSIVPGSRLATRGSREMFAMTKQCLQKWVVSKSQPEKFVYERDLHSLIRDSIARDIDNLEFPPNVQLLDMDYAKDNKLVVLVSFTIEEELAHFAMIILDVDGVEVRIEEKKPLTYKAQEFDPNSVSLSLSNGGPTAFIFFPDAIIMTTIARGINYDEVLPLQNDRILGFGVDRTKAWDREHENTSRAVVFCSNTGIIGVDLNLHGILAGRSDESAGSYGEYAGQQDKMTEQLKAKLEQAVFFASLDEYHANPISFDMPEINGNMDEAAMDLSTAIVESGTKHIPAVLEVKYQLSEKLNRLNQIIRYITINMALDKISIPTRHKLCSNAEKVSAALNLWHYQNSLLARSGESKEPHARILSDAIEQFMTAHNQSEDVVRSFFRNHISFIGELLEYVQRLVQNIISISRSHAFSKEVALYEANKIFLIVLKSAETYRTEHAEVYGLVEVPPTEPWTSTKTLLDLLQTQCEHTQNLLRQGSGEDDIMVGIGGVGSRSSQSKDRTSLYDFGDDDVMMLSGAGGMATSGGDPLAAESGVPLRDMMKTQLCHLTDILLGTFEERIRFLASANKTAVVEREVQTLQGQFNVARPRFILPLVPLGRRDDAFRLAEKYQDFETLVELSLRESPEEQADRLRYYIEKFQGDFANVLYRTYLRKGSLRKLFEQPESYDDMVNSFLSDAKIPWLSWIQDIRSELYENASNKLWDTAKTEASVARQKTAFNLSKLSFLASVPLELMEDQHVSSRLQEYNVLSELMSLQEHLKSTFDDIVAQGTRLSSTDGSPDMETRVNIISSVFYSHLEAEHPGLWFLCRHLVRQVLEERSLDPENMIELLTLGPKDENVMWLVSAMEVVIKASKEIPEDRLSQTVSTIWTRAWLHSSWGRIAEIAKSSADEVGVDQLKTTAVFAILTNTNAEAPFPSQIAFNIDQNTIKSRFPQLSSEQIEQLHKDLTAEAKLLQDGVANYYLDDVLTECMRLR